MQPQNSLPPSDKSIEKIFKFLWQTPQTNFPITKEYLLENGFDEEEIIHFFKTQPVSATANFAFNADEISASDIVDKIAQVSIEGKESRNAKNPTCAAMLVGGLFPSIEMIYAELRKHGWSNEELANQWEEIMAIAGDNLAAISLTIMEAAE